MTDGQHRVIVRSTKTWFRRLLHHLIRTWIEPILQLAGRAWSIVPSTYITVAQLSNVHGQKLHWNDCKNSLQTVDLMRHLDCLVCKLLNLFVIIVTDHNRIALSTTHVSDVNHETKTNNCTEVESLSSLASKLHV